MNTQGERLRAARISAGFKTAREAAKNFAWNEDTLRSHEGGHRQISKKAALRYSSKLGVTASWLLWGDDDKEVNDRLEIKNDWGTASDLSTSSETTRKGGLQPLEAVGVRIIPILGWRSIENMESRNKVALSAAKIGRLLATDDQGFSPAVFAVVIKDEAMNDPKSSEALRPGDHVIIDPEAELVPGKPVLFHVKGEPEAMLRRLRMTFDPVTEQQKYTFLPTHADFDPRTVAKDAVAFVYMAVSVVRRL